MRERKQARAAPPPLREAFRPKESEVIRKYRTPRQVQAFLRALPYNWEKRKETLRTFRGVVRHWKAHCLEAALTAATILEQHGYPPLLLDLESQDNLDHVLFLFRRRSRWGTVARSRDAGLHGRKPVFRTLKTGLRPCSPASRERATVPQRLRRRNRNKTWSRLS